MNNKLINYIKSIRSFTEKKIGILFDCRSSPDPDPLFPEVDPRIRILILIHIKLKRIRNTALSKAMLSIKVNTHCTASLVP